MRKRKSIKKNKMKNMNIISCIMFLIFIIISIVMIVTVISSNMIPTKYITIGVIATIISIIINYLVLFKLCNKVINIVIYIFILIFAIGSIFINSYLGTALKALEEISGEILETEDFYIITSNKSKIKNIEDLEEKYLYMFENSENYKDIIDEINSTVKVNYSKLDSLEKLAEKVVSNNDSAILITASQYSMIMELNPEFKDISTILKTLEHIIGTQTTDVKVNNEYTIEKGKFNVYISGIDTNGRISNVSRSDSNILVTIDTTEEKVEVLMTSIPRDYYVPLNKNGKMDKLTHSGIYGIKETVSTVEDLLDIQIDYYARVNFTTLITIVDALGGIKVDSDFAFTGHGYTFKKGINYLNGAQALSFSRERYSFKDGDIQRNKNQQKVIEAIVDKALSTDSIINNYTNILKTISNSFQTNISSQQISYLIKNQIDNFKSVNINMYSMIGTGKKTTTYSMGSQKLYVMIPDEKSIETAREKILKVLE